MSWYNLVGVFIAAFFTFAFWYDLEVGQKGQTKSALLTAIVASVGFTLAFL